MVVPDPLSIPPELPVLCQCLVDSCPQRVPRRQQNGSLVDFMIDDDGVSLLSQPDIRWVRREVSAICLVISDSATDRILAISTYLDES